ncbi:hypothetical protein ABC389_08010 [Limosilactobacillus sp. WILCCON 0053]
MALKAVEPIGKSYHWSGVDRERHRVKGGLVDWQPLITVAA